MTEGDRRLTLPLDEDAPAKPSIAAAPAPKKPRRKRRRMTPKQLAAAVTAATPAAQAAARQVVPRADIFAGFEVELAGVDWNDTIAREAAMHSMISRLMAKVITVPKLTDAERERMQWLISLSKQLKEHREPAAIDAALRKLRGEDDVKQATVSGPALEATVVASAGEHQSEESGERGARPTLRGRPRTRALA